AAWTAGAAPSVTSWAVRSRRHPATGPVPSWPACTGATRTTTRASSRQRCCGSRTRQAPTRISPGRRLSPFPECLSGRRSDRLLLRYLPDLDPARLAVPRLAVRERQHTVVVCRVDAVRVDFTGQVDQELDLAGPAVACQGREVSWWRVLSSVGNDSLSTAVGWTRIPRP